MTDPTTAEQALYEVFIAAGNTLQLTHADLREHCSMNPRTIRWATRQLVKHGKITQKFNFRDGRRPLYQLKSAPVTIATGEGKCSAQ